MAGADVLVVEDEGAIAELLELNLRHAGYRVRLTADAVAAQAAVELALPDAVVLDWMLPGQSGPQLARRWRADPRTRALPVIMLTARSTESDKVEGLDAGADDYLAKPFSPRELLARLRALLRRRGGDDVDAPVEADGRLRLDPATHRVSGFRGGAWHELRLGPTEYRLLQFLLTNPERVHSRARLLDRVWGEHSAIEERTVDVHVKRLRDALQPVHASALIETVRGAGYRLNPRAAVDGP